MSVGDQNPSLDTFVLDLSSGWSPHVPPQGQRYVDAGSHKVVSGSLWKDFQNLKFHDGGLRFRYAMREFYEIEVNAEAPNEMPANPTVDAFDEYILEIYQTLIPDSADPEIKKLATIVLTSFSVYVCESTGVWEWRTVPSYTTGTVSWSNVSTTVTGSGTAWNTDKAVSPGNTIDLGGAFHVIDSVASDTSLVVRTTPADTQSAQAYTIWKTFNPDWDGGPGSHLFMKVFNGLVYVAGTCAAGKGAPAAMVMTGPNFAAIDRQFSYLVSDAAMEATVDAITMEKVYGILLLQTGHVVLATEAFDDHISRINWSSPANQAQWSTLPGTFTDVVSGGERWITALGTIGRIHTLHYAETIAVAHLTGQDSPPFDLQPSRANVGCVFPRTLRNFDGYQYFLAEDGSVYRFDATRTTPVTAAFRQEVEDFRSHYLEMIPFAWVDNLHDEYCFSVGDGKAYIVSLRTGETRIEEHPANLSTVSRVYYGDPGLDFATAQPWPSRKRGIRLTGYMMGSGGSSGSPIRVFRDGFGQDSVFSPASNPTIKASTHPLDFGRPHVLKVVERVIFRVRKGRSSVESDLLSTLPVTLITNGGTALTPTNVSLDLTSVATDAEELEYHAEFDAEVGAESWEIKLEGSSSEWPGEITKVALRVGYLGETEAMEAVD